MSESNLKASDKQRGTVIVGILTTLPLQPTSSQSSVFACFEVSLFQQM